MKSIRITSSFITFSIYFNLNAQVTLSEIKPYSDTLKHQIESFQFDKAQSTVNFLDSIAKKSSDDSVIGFVFKLKGNYYYRTSDYERAMSNWLEAGNKYEIINDSIEASKIFNNISLILNASKEYEKSLKLKKKALLLCPKNFDDWKISLIQNIASTYRDLKVLDSSLYYLNSSYGLAKKLDSKHHLGTYHFSKALHYLGFKDYEKAINHLDTLNKSFSKDISRPMYENAVFYEATILYELNRYIEALPKAKENLNMVLESGMVVNAAENYELLSNIYEKLNDYKLSLEALRNANVYRDSIFTLEKNKAVIELEQKYQTEKKEKENLKLTQEASEKDLTIARKNNYLLFGSLVFAVIVMSLIVYQLRKFKNKNEALQKSIEKREKIEKELEIVRDNIAKDFHDDLGNKLARITVLSDYMIQSKANKSKDDILSALKRIKSDSDILYKGTRDFMFSLKAKSDYAEELFTYLSDFGEDFFQSFDIDFYVEKELDSNLKLPYYWNRQIIMIFKEAMTNAAKYSKATEVKLIMILDDKRLNIVFKDNGLGFDLNEVSNKNGLSNMQVRAEKINAILSIESTNNGTEIGLKAQLPN